MGPFLFSGCCFRDRNDGGWFLPYPKEKFIEVHAILSNFVTPAKAGVQNAFKKLDSGFRRNDITGLLKRLCFYLVPGWLMIGRKGDFKGRVSKKESKGGQNKKAPKVLACLRRQVKTSEAQSLQRNRSLHFPPQVPQSQLHICFPISYLLAFVKMIRDFFLGGGGKVCPSFLIQAQGRNKIRSLRFEV